jgi:hypothetical protein
MSGIVLGCGHNFDPELCPHPLFYIRRTMHITTPWIRSITHTLKHCQV